MSSSHYPWGDEIHAGDRIAFQGEKARVLFVKRTGEFAPGVSPSDWEFMPEDTIALEFEDGRMMCYDSFCGHDAIELVSRARDD